MDQLNIKYHDNLLFAQHTLQSRLYAICEDKSFLVPVIDGPEEWRQDIIQYTCYMLGSYLAWGLLWRREANLLLQSTNPATRRSDVSSRFQHALESREKGAFGLPPASRRAISESMIDGQRPLTYVKFLARWEDPSFSDWFRPWSNGLIELATARAQGDHDIQIDDRLRELQHILVEMVVFLDPKGTAVPPEKRPVCRRLGNTKRPHSVVQ